MNATFRGVFVHRYRDKLPEIRAVCIEELGMWLKTDPEDFLNDGCLKYLGWTLHDKQSPVRLQCVRALQGLYQEKEFIGRLELFTSRFKERILSMVLDKEPDVALQVVNLLLLIQQSSEGGLEEDECGHIYPLVFASHRGLACAAGNFLYHRMKCMFDDQKQESLKSDNAAFIQMIIAFYTQCEFHEHGAYLVDSLWDVAGSELRDWETMTAYLLVETGMLDEEEGALIELMVCAIQRASQATPPVGRSQGKKILSIKDKKIQEQDRGRITAHFIPLLPQLLTKHLDQLLSQICGIVEKHTAATVLEACAHLASSLCSERYTFSSRAHTTFSQLLDTLTDCFNSYLNELLQGSADEDDVYSAAIALKRIGALSCERSVRNEPVLQTLVHLPSDSLRSEMAAFLLDYVFTDSDDEDLSGDVDEETKITQLQRKRKQLAGYCKLVIYGVLDLSAATDVFKKYDKYFKDYGDIIRETISKTKLISPVLSAKTVCLSLQQLFSEMLTEERSKQDLCEIRDLAKRLAMSFGIDLHRARKPLVALHMDGIRFAFRASQGDEELPNAPFLEVLSMFSFKLLPKDRAQLISFLKSECPEPALCWSPVRLYQRSLEARTVSKPRDHERGDQSEAVTAQNSPVPKRKRTIANDSAMNSSSFHSSLPTPVLTSTVLKEPSKALISEESHEASSLTEPQSEEDFSSTSQMRVAKANKRRLPKIRKRAAEHSDLNSHLTLLSLIDDIEEEEPNIEDYESDSDHLFPHR
ncbi:hypothetical protein WMY93_008805 [Mugilogobius chulae]|uniref:SCD domain-containing protein n=1 Tax=Mugilogobius chulae TaxID=88201 RepID=A0AAW0P9Q1_9GOBI